MNSIDKETRMQTWNMYRLTWIQLHPYDDDPKKNRDIQHLSSYGYKDKPNYNNLAQEVS